MDKIEKGKEILAKVDGSAAGPVVDALADVAPDVTRLMLEFVFGDIYAREGLNLRDREIVTLTSLLTQGDTVNQLRVHIQAALHVGLTREEIIEVFIHCIPYVGFPKVLNAIYVAKEIFSQDKKS